MQMQCSAGGGGEARRAAAWPSPRTQAFHPIFDSQPSPIPFLTYFRLTIDGCGHLAQRDPCAAAHLSAANSPIPHCRDVVLRQRRDTAYPPNKFPDSEVLLATTFASRDTWATHLRAAGVRVRLAHVPEDLEDLSAVEFAIAWAPQPSLLQRCPRLRAIQSMGAGVDSLLSDPTLPRSVPLLRVIDPLMTQRMATWVLWAVINIQRRCDEYAAAQAAQRWDKGIENFRNIDNGELRVGVMGAGVMGGAGVEALAGMGYDVATWTRTARNVPGSSRSFSGKEQLHDFAAATDVLVCLLPLTADTRGILNAELFNTMPEGAAVINAARGGHLIESDLLDALDSGRLRAAVLDVFEPEPLPPTSPLWTHPKVRVFPHVSSMTNLESAVEQMLENRLRVLTGAPLPQELVVDWQAGY